ncbi:hypothetical protein SHKM778_22160 [Streptomyces sp. KM77-8]|uniref:Peptidase S8/S53 domain-containing protein n=1 Tax=Streptomyces haneummycinicus TaxID=3074435 RepID=A0AAT9HEE0_9ACTN
MGVGAITEEIKRLPISQRGTEVDVTAPGHDMVSACLSETRVCRSEGTSDATAIASASAAILWSKHPEWTNHQVLRVLINTMKGNEKSWTRNDEFGYGIVRPRVALMNPGDPGPADEYPLPDLAAAASAAPSAQTSPSASAKPNPVVEDLSDDEGDKIPWVALGTAAAALLAGAVALLVAVRAHRQRSTPAPAAPPHPPGYGPRPGQVPIRAGSTEPGHHRTTSRQRHREGTDVSFEEMWGQARSEALTRQQSSTRLNQLPASGGGGAGGSDYTVTSPDLKAVGNEAQELYHGFEADAFHAGATTDTAANSLSGDGFETGSAMWSAWDTWRSQAEALLSACAHIHNHLEDTVLTHTKHEEVLVTNLSVEQINKHFK